jgi:hypothetical protein
MLSGAKKMLPKTITPPSERPIETLRLMSGKPCIPLQLRDISAQIGFTDLRPGMGGMRPRRRLDRIKSP